MLDDSKFKQNLKKKKLGTPSKFLNPEASLKKRKMKDKSKQLAVLPEFEDTDVSHVRSQKP